MSRRVIITLLLVTLLASLVLPAIVLAQDEDTPQFFRTVEVQMVRVISAVNIRRDAGTSFEILRQAQYGEEFKVREGVEQVVADGYTWIPVTVDEQEFWIAQEGFLEMFFQLEQVPVTSEEIDLVYGTELPADAVDIIVQDSQFRAVDDVGQLVAVWDWGTDYKQGYWRDFRFSMVKQLGGSFLKPDISPDETQLAVGTSRGEIVMYSFPELELLMTVKVGESFSFGMWSPDGEHFASVDYTGMVRIWDAGDWQETAHYQVVARDDSYFVRIDDIAWSPSGTHLSMGIDDGTIHMWNLSTDSAPDIWKGHTDLVTSVSWSPDGSELVSAGYDHIARFWDVTAGSQIPERTVSKGADWVEWSPNGDYLASSRKGNTFIWDAMSGQQVAALEGEDLSNSNLAWSPDSEKLAIGGEGGFVRVWQFGRHEEPDILPVSDIPWVNGLTWSSDNTRLVVCGSDSLQIWDIRELQQTAQQDTLDVWAASWSPDGTRLAVATRYGARVLSTANWQEVSHLNMSTDPSENERLMDTSWSPDGNRLAAASTSGIVRVWDVNTNEMLLVLRGHTDWAESVAWSPDGTRLASVGRDGTLRVWNANAGQQLLVLRERAARLIDVAWSPDSTRIATVGISGQVVVWNSYSGQQIHMLFGHSAWCVTWSPDGTRLVSGGTDLALRVREVHSGEETAVFRGHRSRVVEISWSPDGELLASGDSDGNIVIWGENGEKYTTLLSSTIWPEGVEWASDSARLAIVGREGTVQIWEIQH